MLPKSKVEYYILPALLILFFIQFHYYKFFSQKFGEIAQYVDSKQNTYEQIQKQHQYAELYELAQTYKNTTTPVYLVTTLADTDFLDYTTTFYLKQLNGSKHPPAYLTELTIMTYYFFYPRIIQNIPFKQLHTQTLTRGNILIADQDLRNIFPPTPNLSIIPTNPKVFVMNVKKPPKLYYLFEVTQ